MRYVRELSAEAQQQYVRQLHCGIADTLSSCGVRYIPGRPKYGEHIDEPYHSMDTSHWIWSVLDSESYQIPTATLAQYVAQFEISYDPIADRMVLWFAYLNPYTLEVVRQGPGQDITNTTTGGPSK